ncbi:hypothetical protein OS175_07415 [Marinicella sp. S1101]|uniref:hypothetical protein n=1 Tax=Marinicella marina TaxID=2996016 RepID=UPI002260F052|nr:hypothetical protein [Marinicella marina]MCX7553703.1 hypothetical protein [Marinicella marina]MDJ1140793.1 hypothetical protein [Marinicella marina]
MKKYSECKFLLSIVLVFLMLTMNVDAQQRKHRMLVTGSESFQLRTAACLDLLFEKYRESYKFVNKHVGVIAQASSSGMVAWHRPPMYQMSNKTASYSLSWCASSIAHDAYHSYLYKKFRPKNGSRTPDRYWADFKAERLAISYQVRVA